MMSQPVSGQIAHVCQHLPPELTSPKIQNAHWHPLTAKRIQWAVLCWPCHIAAAAGKDPTMILADCPVPGNLVLQAGAVRALDPRIYEPMAHSACQNCPYTTVVRIESWSGKVPALWCPHCNGRVAVRGILASERDEHAEPGAHCAEWLAKRHPYRLDHEAS